MHQKRFEVQIGKDDVDSSDLNVTVPPESTSGEHVRESTPAPAKSQAQPHLPIKISPPFPPNSPTQQHEIVFQNYSEGSMLLSTPHKRPVISQSPSFSRSPTISSFSPDGPAKKVSILTNSDVAQKSSCSPKIPVTLATKKLTLRWAHQSCHSSSWFRVHLKVFSLISLPIVYFLSCFHRWPFFVNFLYFLVFSAVVVISVQLGIPRFPSVRLFLEKNLCFRLSSGSLPIKQSQPRVVWSIGHKEKPIKGTDSGCWVEVYSNGDVYEGEFHKGKCSGSGVYYYHLSGRYEGDWIDEKYDGYGVETWAKGSRYRGQYRQGLRNGVGLYRSFTGDVYLGEWCNGHCHGIGFHSCEDASSYAGEFKWGVKHGLGRYHFRNGDIYAGEYFSDKMHGYGVYHFAHGHRYEGAWHEGKRQGFGTYTFRNGDSQYGYWQNGVLNAPGTSILPATHPGSSSSIVSDREKVFHAVQEAQLAAEKATKLPNPEERVKRAVAAANRAANAARVTAVKAVQNQMHQNSHNLSDL